MANKKSNDFDRIIVKDAEGNKYVLRFTRREVERMERNGFKVDTDKPNTMIKDLFRGAFKAEPASRFVSDQKIDEIWHAQSKKDELLTALTKLYMKPLEDLMAEPEDASDENPTWETM